MRLNVAETLALVLFVFGIGTLEEENLGIPFESQIVGADAVEEPTVVRYDDGTAGEVFETLFKGTQGIDVDVVGRLVEQQHIPFFFERQGQMQAVALSARKDAALLFLVGSGEVEPREISAGIHLSTAHAEGFLTARNDDESRKYGYQLGADSYLAKPFEMDLLMEKILNKLYNRLQTQKHYHQVGIHPLPEENDLSRADSLFMEKLHQAIADNLDNPQLDIPFLCNLMGISRASPYNKLKAITSMGANDYINKIRIERAMKLIKESTLNFTEISEKVGFTSPRYFSTSFKQYTGKTPTEYKKEQ